VEDVLAAAKLASFEHDALAAGTRKKDPAHRLPRVLAHGAKKLRRVRRRERRARVAHHVGIGDRRGEREESARGDRIFALPRWRDRAHGKETRGPWRREREQAARSRVVRENGNAEGLAPTRDRGLLAGAIETHDAATRRHDPTARSQSTEDDMNG